MNTEPAVLPSKELPRQFLGKKLFVYEHLDDPDPEKLLEGLATDLRSHIEHAAPAEETVGYSTRASSDSSISPVRYASIFFHGIENPLCFVFEQRGGFYKNG